MDLRTAEVTSILEKEIEEFSQDSGMQSVGTVLSVGDGVARVYGLDDCVMNELLEFEGGVRGVALNLEEDNVGVVLFGEWDKVVEGDTVKLGFLNSTSGAMAISEQPVRDSLMLAAKEINADGGIMDKQIEFIEEDGPSALLDVVAEVTCKPKMSWLDLEVLVGALENLWELISNEVDAERISPSP